MKKCKIMDYKGLLGLWLGLYVLTAVLGAFLPGAGGWLHGLMMVLSVVFFLPPVLILHRAKQEGNAHYLRLVRLLSILALVLATGFLCLAIWTAQSPAALQATVHILTAILTAPMVCSGFYALPLFLWAVLLMLSFQKKK